MADRPAEIDGFLARYAAAGDKLDVVVFGAPQLSLFEIEAVAQTLDGRQIHPDTTLLVTTSPEIKHAADRMGLTQRIEAAGAVVAQGICFYQSYAREMAEANGWTRLMTNSAKLVNIIGGYGYRPSLAQPRTLRRLGGGRPDAVMPILLRCHKGIGPAVVRHRARRSPTISVRATISTAAEGSSRARATSSPARAMSTASWFSTTPKAGSPPPGCCTKWRRARLCRGH